MPPAPFLDVKTEAPRHRLMTLPRARVAQRRHTTPTSLKALTSHGEKRPPHYARTPSATPLFITSGAWLTMPLACSAAVEIPFSLDEAARQHAQSAAPPEKRARRRRVAITMISCASFSPARRKHSSRSLFLRRRRARKEHFDTRRPSRDHMPAASAGATSARGARIMRESSSATITATAAFAASRDDDAEYFRCRRYFRCFSAVKDRHAPLPYIALLYTPRRKDAMSARVMAGRISPRPASPSISGLATLPALFLFSHTRYYFSRCRSGPARRRQDGIYRHLSARQ